MAEVFLTVLAILAAIFFILVAVVMNAAQGTDERH